MNWKLMIVGLLAIVIVVSGCVKEPETNLDEKSESKDFVIENIDKISEDIAFILRSMEDYVLDENSIDKSIFSDEITLQINWNSDDYINPNSLLHYAECEYVEEGTSGLIECYQGDSRKELGAYWFTYQPFTSDEVESAKYGHISLEIMIKDNLIIIYYPSWTEYSCPNFECLPRTYYE